VLIYRWTGNPRTVQLVLGHTKIESTVRYLGIEVDDATKRGDYIQDLIDAVSISKEYFDKPDFAEGA
jgi:hypothetical protein